MNYPLPIPTKRMIDKSTKPACEVLTKHFDWGEPYLSYNPIFELKDLNGESDLEKSIHFFWEKQLQKSIVITL